MGKSLWGEKMKGRSSCWIRRNGPTRSTRSTSRRKRSRKLWRAFFDSIPFVWPGPSPFIRVRDLPLSTPSLMLHTPLPMVRLMWRWAVVSRLRVWCSARLCLVQLSSATALSTCTTIVWFLPRWSRLQRCSNFMCSSVLAICLIFALCSRAMSCWCVAWWSISWAIILVWWQNIRNSVWCWKVWQVSQTSFVCSIHVCWVLILMWVMRPCRNE